jgi:hypothetical protein
MKEFSMMLLRMEILSLSLFRAEFCIVAIQICLFLLFLYTFAGSIKKHWGEEIAVGAKETNLTHCATVYFFQS